MENPMNMTPEELSALVEKAQRDLQEALDRMTPEERQKAEEKAKALIEEDRRSMQELVEQAAKVAASAPEKPGPKFCMNCGAPVSGGKFCASCGHPLS